MILKASQRRGTQELAKAVHSGSLPVTPETEHAILDACADIRRMRQDLMVALGIATDKGGTR